MLLTADGRATIAVVPGGPQELALPFAATTVRVAQAQEQEHEREREEKEP